MRLWSRITVALVLLSLMLLPAQVLAHGPGATKSKAMGMVQVQVFSPSPGQVFHRNVVPVRVRITGLTLSCAWAGKPDKPGIGHYHVLLDGALVNMFCTNFARVSMQNVTPGRHVLEVVPADNRHNDMMFMKEAKKIAFFYRPTTPLPTLASLALGKPSISITSPANGTTVSGTFTLQVSIRNFRPSCALLGKNDIQGYGHWHANVDIMMGPMMGMGTMLLMSCAGSARVSTIGIKPGAHKFFALLTDNQHAPLMKPGTDAFVTLNVK